MSTAGKSYEAWKESLKQAEAEGDEDWSEELSAASGPVLRRPGAMESNGMGALLVSVGLLIASAVVLLPNFKHLTVGKRTVGIVVGHRNYDLSGSVRAPVVRYSSPGGVYDVLGSLPAARSIYPTGKEVSVLYLPNEPHNAVIADLVQLFLIPMVVGGLGLACLTGTAGFMFWTVRNEVRASVICHRQFTDQPLAVNDPASNDDAEDLDRQREHHAAHAGILPASENAPPV
jgi:Protein of unknown function (DUF3592)